MKKLSLFIPVLFLFAATAARAASITVTLTPGANATSHRIEKKVGTGAYSTLTTLTMPTVQYTDNTVSEGSTVCYRAYGVAALGESTASAECCSALFVGGVPSVGCSINP